MWGTKGLSLRPRCIGAVRFQTQMLINQSNQSIQVVEIPTCRVCLCNIYSLLLPSVTNKVVPHVVVHTDVDYVSILNIGYTGAPQCLDEFRRKVRA
jgi:hypothetical protein